MKESPRASSLVENFNSRLLNYFFLRRTLGNDYLDFVVLLISLNIRNENKAFQTSLFTHNAKHFTHKLKI